jgi:hypothetical protein
LTARDDLELRVYALVNSSAGHAPEHNQTVLVTALGAAELRKQNAAKDPAEVFVPLPVRATQDALELNASLTAHNGVRIGAATLALDQSASMQQSPSLLRRAVAAGSTLLDRLMNVYDNVRAAPEARLIFALSLDDGKPVSAPVALPLARAQYRGLALSPHGKLLAWVVVKPGQYELWASPVEELSPIRVASSAQPMLTPFFAGEGKLLFVTEGRILLAPVDGKQLPRTLDTPFRSVSEIDSVWQAGDAIACIVAAEHADAPGLSSPYLLSISPAGGQASASPLASSPYYRSYPMLVEGAPFFFAGWNDGMEGIHYFQPGALDARVSPLFKVHSPGLVAMAANGSRLVFVGRP